MSEDKSSASIEQTIARHIAAVRFEQLSADAVRATKEHILHTTATVLAGPAAPGCAAFMEQLWLKRWI